MLVSARAWLDATDPRLWPILLALISFAVVYAWRKLHAASFEKIPKNAQALPAVLLAMAFSGMSSSGDVTKVVIDTVLSALMGLAAVGGHHAGKNFRSPSEPAKAEAKPKADDATRESKP